MTIVTDPDNLDRFKVVIDPIAETISLRGLGAVRHAIDSTGSTAGTAVFTDAGADFITTDSVAVGDVLSIISDPADDGGIIGHYRVLSRTATALTVDRNMTTSTAADLDYQVAAPGTVGNASEDVSDGVTLQALYSFLKEEWRTLDPALGAAEDLIQYDFPLNAITREQMIIGGVNGDAISAWSFAALNGVETTDSEGQTRELIRTGGWQERDGSDNILRRYAGVVTLGTVDSDAQVYFQLGDTSQDPVNFKLTGAVNQSVLVTGPDVGPDAVSTGFVFTTTTITRNDGGSWETDGYLVGDFVIIRAAEDPSNIGTFGPILTVATGTDTALTFAAATFTANADDSTAIFQVDHRQFLELRVRKKARTYAQAGLTEIGVTTLEALVNRFPLSHATDPAITLQDGVMAGDGTTAGEIFQETEQMVTVSDGITEATPTASTDSFTLTSATAAFTATVARTIPILLVGDAVLISTGSDAGSYVVKSISSDTVVVLFKDPLLTYTGGESTQTIAVRTGLRDVGSAVGSTADVDSDTGTITDVGGTFTTDTAIGDRIVVAGDMVEITSGTAAILGVYKVISATATIITLNTSDQLLTTETNQTYRVYRPGMKLQRFEQTATIASATNINFADANPDTITRTGGSWITDGFTSGMAMNIISAADPGNTGARFIIDGTPSATIITLIAEEEVTVNATDTTASVDGNITGDAGIVRTINSVSYPFHWRLFSNSASLAQIFQFLQWKLRLTTDIDLSTGVARGDITALLMTFASPNGVTIDLFPDDAAVAEANNSTYNDITGDARVNAFLVGITFSLNGNMTSSDTNKLVAFFTSVPSGTFGSNTAVIVQDSSLANMSFTDSTVDITASYDYTNNSQGGRTPATDAAITVVAIGDDLAQHVLVTATITQVNSLTIAVGPALERNYSNPV